MVPNAFTSGKWGIKAIPWPLLRVPIYRLNTEWIINVSAVITSMKIFAVCQCQQNKGSLADICGRIIRFLFQSDIAKIALGTPTHRHTKKNTLHMQIPENISTGYCLIPDVLQRDYSGRASRTKYGVFLFAHIG